MRSFAPAGLATELRAFGHEGRDLTSSAGCFIITDQGSIMQSHVLATMRKRSGHSL